MGPVNRKPQYLVFLGHLRHQSSKHGYLTCGKLKNARQMRRSQTAKCPENYAEALLQAYMLLETSLFPAKKPGKARNPWKLGPGCAKSAKFQGRACLSPTDRLAW